ncbi:hypothetical protein KJZ61_03805 [Candidatus Dependentiae bacterium]|nr:hypothetical protein [Candidatus Dependentiae bacterium]
MTIRKVFAIISLSAVLAPVTPALNAQNIGFGFGVGGRGGGVSFGVGTGPYGYYGRRYGPWGSYYRPWGYGYYPRTTYVVQEPPAQPVEVEYITTRQQEPTQKMDRQGKSFWRITNATNQDLSIASDTSALKLPAGKESRKLYRDESFDLTVTTADGPSMAFKNVRDHHVNIVRDAEDGNIEIETWNQ